MTDSTDNAHDPTNDGGGFPRWLKWGLLGALALLMVGYGAIFLYAKVINDSPTSFGESDLDAALAGDSSSGPADSTPTAEPTQPTGSSATSQPAADDSGAVAAAGNWSVATGSEVGYRVGEVLFGVDTEAVGRTDQVTGSLEIDDTRLIAAEFVVDVASISSDESRRDSQFRGRIMSADEFPTATFDLTAPIDLGVAAEDGATVETPATGDLTLRGVTNSVTFDLSAKQEDGKIGVLGSIPVVFADFQIANPSVGGITTEDDGQLEFILVFESA